MREPLLSDATDFLVFRGDAIVQRYNQAIITTVAEAQAQILSMQQEFRSGEGISWAVTLNDSGTVIGNFALHNWSRHHRRAEAGYDMARMYWGQRYAVEALSAILRFGFTDMDLHRIYAHTIADNHGSVRLLERLGFRREGTLRESSWEDDATFHDSAIYGLLRREFE